MAAPIEDPKMNPDRVCWSYQDDERVFGVSPF